MQPGGESQTASEFINSQLQLEADAREALPYSFDHCTQPLGPLKQSVFSCLTCNPPPASATRPYKPAGVCYACSIACHGEHNLVELFNRRNFTCDCGTTRLPVTSPCTLKIDPATGMKGPTHSQDPSTANTYNHNFQNQFCGCGELYDPHTQKGTMYQCLGLVGESEGGCGEDWWHPECILGLARDWYLFSDRESIEKIAPAADEAIVGPSDGDNDEDHPVPPAFPDEEEFETLICYKCTDSSPWIKQYAHSEGFIFLPHQVCEARNDQDADVKMTSQSIAQHSEDEFGIITSTKRKAEDDSPQFNHSSSKRLKEVSEVVNGSHAFSVKRCHRLALPSAPPESITLFARNHDFRSTFCRCPDCYLPLSSFPQLLEEEDIYEPPVSEDGENPEVGGSVGTGSLLDRGEAALSNVDRVRAIEGVMVYNHLKDKVKSFLQPFAESGKIVGAEDIKAYFEKLRGDAEAIRAAGGAALAGGNSADGGGDNRKEESGKAVLGITQAFSNMYRCRMLVGHRKW